MKYIENILFRTIVSFIVGAFFSEIVSMKNGSSNEQNSILPMFIGFVISFLLLSLWVWRYRRAGSNKFVSKKKQDKNILDD